MDRRRRKDEPFNPFAPNASQKAKERKEKSHRQPPRPRAPEVKKPQNDLAAKQKAAMEALRKRRKLKINQNPNQLNKRLASLSTNPRRSQNLHPKQKSRSHRREKIASLICVQSQQRPHNLRKKAQDAKKAIEVESVQPTPEVVAETAVEVTIKDAKPIIEAPSPEERLKGASNVFKTIKTEVKKSDRKQKRRRPADKRGGGGNLNLRNWIEENIWNTNMLLENYLKTIQLAKSTVQTSSVKFGLKASVLA